MGLKAKANCSVWFLGPEVCPLDMQRTQTGGVREAGHGLGMKLGRWSSSPASMLPFPFLSVRFSSLVPQPLGPQLSVLHKFPMSPPPT